MNIDVFNYTDPRSYLADVIKHKQNKNQRFSLRSFTRRMGLNNHGQVSLILNKKRPFNLELGKKLALSLPLTPEEGYFLNLLILKQNSASTEEKDIYKHLIAKVVKGKDFRVLSIDEFKFVADWYHVAILEMSSMPDFMGTIDWIREKVLFPISEDQISDALNRLIKLGLIIYCPVKQQLVRSRGNFKTTNEIPSEAIQLFHIQSLENAREAIKLLPVNKREFSSYTMNIDKAKLPVAKMLMRDFQRELARLLETNDASDTFQFQMQLFPLTREVENV